MNKVKFVLNEGGVRELLQSSEMGAVCEQYAKQVAARAGSGYEVDSYTGKNRVNAAVKAETKEAKRDNYRNNTLIKALHG